MIKFGQMNWTVHVLLIEGTKKYFFYGDKLGRKCAIKIVLNNRMWRCKLVSLTEEMNMSQNCVNIVMNIRVPQKSMQHLER